MFKDFDHHEQFIVIVLKNDSQQSRCASEQHLHENIFSVVLKFARDDEVKSTSQISKAVVFSQSRLLVRMIISLKKLSKSRASAKIIVILIEIQLFDTVDLNDEKSTSDYHMRFKAKQTKDHRMRETHQSRTFVVVKERYELDNNNDLDCFCHVTRETKLQQMKNLQHIILNNQFDSSAENDDDEMIFVTNFKSSVRIQKIDRVSHLTKMCEQTILTLNVDQNNQIF